MSGGQRQRMAIARAILRDAPILILDEQTAALDVESEAEVMHALEKLIVGRTVIMISHRLNTLGNVEEIIVLKNGQIAEQGSFQDLKRRGGVFAGLLAEPSKSTVTPGPGKVCWAAFGISDFSWAGVGRPLGSGTSWINTSRRAGGGTTT